MTNTIFRALIADEPHPVAAQLLKDNGFEVTEVKKLTPDIYPTLGNYEALIVRSGDVKDPAIFANAKKLRVICRAGSGYDNIDRAIATERDIVVMNAPDGNAPAAAELTMGHILNLARQITLGDSNMRKGVWTRTPHKNDFQIRGKNLGIIGCGRIGSLVATYAKSFGMKLFVYDPYIPESKTIALGAQKVQRLEDLLALADIVTLHADLNGETRGMIDKKRLAQCKKGARIVNCARGPMVVAGDLAEAIRAGHIAAASLDVIANEPTKGDIEAWKANPLFDLDRVTFTPHIGGTTKESLEDVAREAAQQAIDYLRSGIIGSAVNEPYASHAKEAEIIGFQAPHKMAVG